MSNGIGGWIGGLGKSICERVGNRLELLILHFFWFRAFHASRSQYDSHYYEHDLNLEINL